MDGENEVLLMDVLQNELSTRAGSCVEPNVSPAVEPNISPAVEPNVSTAMEPNISPAVEPNVSPAVESNVSPTEEPDTSSSVVATPGTSKSCNAELEVTNEATGNVSPGRSTPDSCCSICLGAIVNKSFTNSCMHQFCFLCLKQWSKVKPECPLCKQNFKSIYYNVRSIEDFQQYVLPLPNSGRRTVYPDLVPNNRNESNYFFGFDDWENMLPPALRNNATAAFFRRSVYQRGLWVQSSNLNGLIRDSCPEIFRSNPLMLNRLVPWLRRELHLLCTDTMELVLTIVLDLVCTVPIRSRIFYRQVEQYLGRHTEHFIHEFNSFVISPYDVNRYDRIATYVHRDTFIYNEGEFNLPSSDEDVQEVLFQGSRSEAPIVPINLASDSDDCVIVDALPPLRCPTHQRYYIPETTPWMTLRSQSPEVITLESDDNDDADRENIPTSSVPLSRTQPYSRVQRPFKCSSVTVHSTPEGVCDLNVSININLPGPSHSRGGTSLRCRHIIDSPSDTGSTSDSDPSPDWTSNRRRPSKKTSKTKSKSDKRNKGKATNRSSQKEEPVVNDKQKSSKVECRSLVLPLKKRRHRLVVLSSSSDDESSVLQIDAEPELLALVDPELSEKKLTLNSVDVKTEIKTEPLDVYSLPSSSGHGLQEVKTENCTLVSESSTPAVSVNKDKSVKKRKISLKRNFF